MTNKKPYLALQSVLVIILFVVISKGQRTSFFGSSGQASSILRALATPHEPLDYLLRSIIGPPLGREKRRGPPHPPPRHPRSHSKQSSSFNDVQYSSRETRFSHDSCEKGHKFGGFSTHFSIEEDSFLGSHSHSNKEHSFVHSKPKFNDGKNEHSFVHSNAHFNEGKNKHSFESFNNFPKKEEISFKHSSGLKSSDVFDMPFELDGMNFNEFLVHGFHHPGSSSGQKQKQGPVKPKKNLPIPPASNNNKAHQFPSNDKPFTTSNKLNNNLKQSGFDHAQSNTENIQINPDHYKNHHVEQVLNTIPFKTRLPLESETSIGVSNDFIDHFPPGHSPPDLKNAHDKLPLISNFDELPFQLPLETVNTIGDTFHPSPIDSTFKQVSGNDFGTAQRFFRSAKAPSQSTSDDVVQPVNSGDSVDSDIKNILASDYKPIFRSTEKPNINKRENLKSKFHPSTNTKDATNFKPSLAPKQNPKVQLIKNVEQHSASEQISNNIYDPKIRNFGPISVSTEPFEGSQAIDISDLHKLISGIVDENGNIKEFKDWNEWMASNERERVRQIIQQSEQSVVEMNSPQDFIRQVAINPQQITTESNLINKFTINEDVNTKVSDDKNKFLFNSFINENFKSSNPGSPFPRINTNKLPDSRIRRLIPQRLIPNNNIREQFDRGINNIKLQPSLLQFDSNDVIRHSNGKNFRRDTLTAGSNLQREILYAERKSNEQVQHKNQFRTHPKNVDKSIIPPIHPSYIGSLNIARFYRDFIKNGDEPKVWVKESTERNSAKLFGQDNILGALELVMEAVSNTDKDETLYLVRTNDVRKKRKAIPAAEERTSSYTSYEFEPILEFDLREVNGDGSDLETSSYSKLKKRKGD